MRLALGLLGLVALGLAWCSQLADRAQPTVLIDTPDPAQPPLDDLNLNEGKR